MTSQRGNILFLILLAVVLFAALAYAVTSSMRGGGRDASNETNDLMASQILQYTTLVESTIMRARLMYDVKDYAWDFVGGNSWSMTANNTCTSSNCRVFSTSAREGLMTSQPIPAKALANPSGNQNGRAYFRHASVLGIGTSAEDVVLMYAGLVKPVCEAINKQLNIKVDLTVPDLFGGTNQDYNGTLTDMPVTGSALGDESPDLVGKTSACYYHSAPANYYFYHVVLTR